jgi:hypothetical protein
MITLTMIVVMIIAVGGMAVIPVVGMMMGPTILVADGDLV